MHNKIKVLVVDDSALIRKFLRGILESDQRLEVVDVAYDAFVARELINKHNPDVLTLDIEMPKMNGITFLKSLMRLHPMPVVMISSLTHEGAPATLQALEIGAIDFVAKPVFTAGVNVEGYRETIIEKVVNASRARVRPYLGQDHPSEWDEQTSKNAQLVKGKFLRNNFICAIGASTGGTQALKTVVTALPRNCPPIVVVQHIPAAFSASFAKRIDSLSEVNVYEADDNQIIEPGCVYMAPGHSHLKVVLLGNKYVCKLDSGEPVNRHRPSVDVLFDSVTQVARGNALGVLLTGMGADGAQGLLHMQQARCETIAQDENSSVVWGMPGAAVKLGAANKISDINEMAKNILSTALR